MFVPINIFAQTHWLSERENESENESESEREVWYILQTSRWVHKISLSWAAKLATHRMCGKPIALLYEECVSDKYRSTHIKQTRPVAHHIQVCGSSLISLVREYRMALSAQSLIMGDAGLHDPVDDVDAPADITPAIVEGDAPLDIAPHNEPVGLEIPPPSGSASPTDDSSSGCGSIPSSARPKATKGLGGIKCRKQYCIGDTRIPTKTLPLNVGEWFAVGPSQKWLRKLCGSNLGAVSILHEIREAVESQRGKRGRTMRKVDLRGEAQSMVLDINIRGKISK